MLVLFDIDATLISTGGAGIRAMGDAGRRLHGSSFRIDGVEFAGRLDPLIIDDLLVANGLTLSASVRETFRREYRCSLETRLQGTERASSLPGVTELLAELRRLENVAIGLVTGNFPETGMIKLAAAGIDSGVFTFAAWGDQSRTDPPTRDDLPLVAIEQYERSHRKRIDREGVIVIGDTVHDVRCARVNGCRCLGVATGQYSSEKLADAGADRVVPNLSDTAGIVSWLLR